MSEVRRWCPRQLPVSPYGLPVTDLGPHLFSTQAWDNWPNYVLVSSPRDLLSGGLL